MSNFSYMSPELKIRTLALADDTMLSDFGEDPTTFRWYDRQLVQNEIGKLLKAGACARVRRISTIRETNQSGIMNISRPRIQIDVLDREAETARVIANDVILFMMKIDLCSLGQFQSPYVGPRQNPVILLNQLARMITGPQSPGGPVYIETLDFRVANREDQTL